MLENSQEYGSFFGYAPARDFASFIRTANMASQSLGIDAGAENIQATGTGNMVINGVHAAFGAHGAYDISAGRQLEIWETAKSYTTADMRYVVNPSSGLKIWYKCIADHTSAAGNKPDENDLRGNATWKTYWTRSTQTAEAARGHYIPSGQSCYYVILAQHAADSCVIVRAGEPATDDAQTLVIPNFEPEMFCAIGTLLVDSAGFTVGTTALTGIDTYLNFIGPVFPTGTGIDGN